MVHTRTITPRERVEKEIRKHHEWCDKSCISFSPSKYRKARLEQGLTHLELVSNKGSCHN